MSFIYVADGIDDVLAAHLNQYADAWSGVAGKGQPFNAVAVNDPIQFAISARNLDPTNSRTLQLLKADGTVLFQCDASGVKVSPDGALAGVPVTTTGTQTVSNKTFTNSTFDATNKVPVKLGEVVLGASAANIDFAGIAGTYRHLMLEAYVRSDNASANVALLLRFNADAGANYDHQILYANAAAPASQEAFAQAGITIARAIPANTAIANAFGGVQIQIPHYANAANNKTAQSTYAHKQGTTTTLLETGSVAGFWRSIAAITEVTLLPSLGNFVTGSMAVLYGMP